MSQYKEQRAYPQHQPETVLLKKITGSNKTPRQRRQFSITVSKDTHQLGHDKNKQ